MTNKKFLRSTEYKNMSKTEAFEVLGDKFKELEQSVLTEMKSLDGFRDPAWSEKHAYHLGKLKLLEQLIAFLPDRGN